MQHSGYIRFGRLCPPDLIAAANARIEDDLARHYDPARQVEYDARSYCPDLVRHPDIVNLLTHPDVRARIDTLVPLAHTDEGHHHAQIAIRRAHNAPRPVPPEPHIDGVATGTNGVEGPELQTFTFLVGIFLTETRGPFAGNFTVWPGSHLRHAAHFRSRGRRALLEGIPDVERGAPVQLQTWPGDVVVAHYQLAHAAAVNTSPHDRRAVFFRVSHRDLPQRRWAHLTDPWAGWTIRG